MQALELTFAQLVPRLGEPVAVQRRLEFTLAPGLVEWTVVCYLDLETRSRTLTGEPLDRVLDYKVKSSLIGQPTADRDPQASLYLAGRWLEGGPAAQFCFAQIAKPGICRNRHMPGYVAPGTMLLPALAAMRSWGGRCRIGRAAGVESRRSIDYVKRARNAMTRRSRERPTTVSKLGETRVVREADQGCQLGPPAGSTEAPGATG